MDIFLVAVRLILAAILGAVIGIEREIKNRAAGFRTHIIVSVGACLIMLIGIDAIGDLSSDNARDAARLAGQVVSGIGFLGAGTILQKRMAYQVLLQLQLCGFQERLGLLWELDIMKVQLLQLLFV
ncbi:MgtC family protein [Finegoldia magna]|nr:MgtC/SapB family protein [Finegoldia magna]PWV45532.1 MgtC family protein [Finegoldia magna]